MEYHYHKHHQRYLNNLNLLQKQAKDALEKGETKRYNDLSQAIKFNDGGHLNHEFFWENLAPLTAGGGVLPDVNSKLHKLLV